MVNPLIFSAIVACLICPTILNKVDEWAMVLPNWTVFVGWLSCIWWPLCIGILAPTNIPKRWTATKLRTQLAELGVTGEWSLRVREGGRQSLICECATSRAGHRISSRWGCVLLLWWWWWWQWQWQWWQWWWWGGGGGWNGGRVWENGGFDGLQRYPHYQHPYHHSQEIAVNWLVVSDIRGHWADQVEGMVSTMWVFYYLSTSIKLCWILWWVFDHKGPYHIPASSIMITAKWTKCM